VVGGRASGWRGVGDHDVRRGARSHLLWLALLGMALPAGLHAGWRELTGRAASDALGRVAALVVFAGSQLAFLPLLVLGLRGASFRANAYPPEFQVLNVLALAGATVLLAGLALSALAFIGPRRIPASRGPLVAAALLLAVLMGGGCGSGAMPADAKELRVTVSGMHCEGCSEGITRKLRRQKGVLETDVHFSNTVQIVRYDAARVDADRLVAVITNAGFTVSAPAPSP
jgi:copper chaperone CopZ